MREVEEAYAITCNTPKNSHWNHWVSEANDCISPTQLWRKIKIATGTDQMSPRQPEPTFESNRILNGFVERSSSIQLPHGPTKFNQAKIINAKAQ